MKVVAHTKGGVLLEASANEVIRLVGFYNSSVSGAPQRLDIGMTIEVNAMFERLYEQEHARTRLSAFAAELRLMANLFDTLNPVAEAVAVGEELPE